MFSFKQQIFLFLLLGGLTVLNPTVSSYILPTMSRDFPQESTTPEPVSTSRESLFDSVMQEVIRNPLPVLRIRGTHKSASDPDGEYVDFDLKLAQPEDTIREYLRMDGNSYDPINMNEIQDKVRGLCDRFRTTETEHSMYVAVL